jgi:LacI family transcriptional regulator
MPERLPSRRITTHDVAARAGVSQPTVSLVLSRNARARVAPETRERVLQAAAELGYRPNVVARSLVQRRSYALGIIVPDLRNPFFADVISGVERVAAAEGYATLLCEAALTPAERHLETLQGRLIDGVIIDSLGAASLPDGVLEGLNVVLIDEPSERWPGVASDALGAGRLAAEHLLALGHRRVAFLGPAADVHGFRMRERGFVHALRAAGVSLDSALLRRVPATVDGGRAAMRAVLALAARPTALFCANDLMALGALKACSAAGVRVPGEMSIVGCDDIEMATLVTPELTTIAVPARELGARAARRSSARSPATRRHRHRRRAPDARSP